MKKFSYILVFLLSSMIVFAQKKNIQEIINNPPVPAKLVNDYASILTEDQKQTLENKLVALDDSTFTQITVVIVNSLDGMPVDEAAIDLGRKWGVGNKNNNSGVVLLISKDDRKLNISPGYGLEGALTDVEASHIIDDIIVPKFKGDDYYRGIYEGVDAIYKAVHGVYKTPREKRISGGSILPFIIIVIVLIVLMAGGGGGGKGTFMSRRGTRGLAETIFWTNVLGGGGRGGGGWGGGGSSGGGGFGGFGGGSFGGGGASGSW